MVMGRAWFARRRHFGKAGATSSYGLHVWSARSHLNGPGNSELTRWLFRKTSPSNCMVSLQQSRIENMKERDLTKGNRERDKAGNKTGPETPGWYFGAT